MDDSHKFNWSFVYNRVSIDILSNDIEQSIDKLQDLIIGVCGVTIDKSLLVWNFLTYSGDIKAPSIVVYLLNALDKDDNIRYNEEEEELFI